MMYVLPAVGLPQVDLPVWVARLLVSDPVQVGPVGLVVRLIVGFAFAWLYVAQVEPRLARGSGTSGLFLGFGLWLFAQAIAVPALRRDERSPWAGLSQDSGYSRRDSV